jgi:hypothetical protein
MRDRRVRETYCIANGIENLLISLYVRTREVFRRICKTSLHSVCSKGLAHALVGGNCKGLISRIGQPTRVDGRQLSCAGARYSHRATGEGRNKGAEDGRILVAIFWLGCEEIGEITNITWCRKVFDLGLQLLKK